MHRVCSPYRCGNNLVPIQRRRWPWAVLAVALVALVAAALVVAAQNFDTNVVTYLMVIAVIGLVVLMPTAGELGKRAAAPAAEAAA